MSPLDFFANAVRDFCNWAEMPAPAGNPKQEMELAQRHLSFLYCRILDLPAYACDWNDDGEVTTEEWRAVLHRFGTLPVGYYVSALNPLVVPDDKVGLGDLADDLADTWRDLKHALLLFDAGHRDQAGFAWQESFTIHWGLHAAGALSIIRHWLGENRYTCFES